MKPQSTEQSLLAALVRTARSEPLLDIDERVLEAQLRQRWLTQSTPQLSRPRSMASFLRRSSVALGVAAFLAIAFVGLRFSADHHQVESHSSESPGVDGGQLRIGQRIATAARPQSITRAGVATWSLAPHTQTKVIELSPCLTLGLERGRIEADVVPREAIESFAIQTSTHRIAVRGTRFAAEVDSRGVFVEVSSGAVMVTRLDGAEPSASSLMTAPQRMRFPSKPSAPESSPAMGAPTGSIAPRRTRASTPALEATTAPRESPAPTPELPLQPSVIEQETMLDAVRAAAIRCLARMNGAGADQSSDLRVRVETQLTLNIAPSGTVQEIWFEPPVSREIADCTRRESVGWSSSPSKSGATPTRAVILTQ